jgi:hypothetical protein
MLGKKAREGSQGLLAGMVLKPLGVGFRSLGVEPDRQEEPDDQFMSRPGCRCDCLAGWRQKQPAVGFGIHQAVALQPRDCRGDSRLRNSHTSGNVHSPRLAFFLEEVGDELDVILGDRRAVCLTLLREASCLVFGGR